MKYINITGLLLILAISTIGNSIAPGRYCTYYNNDTVWALGATNRDETSKEGLWVFLGKSYPSNNITLSSVGTYKDDRLQGWLITFDGDSLLYKFSEQYFSNDTLNGDVRFFNKNGKCNLVMSFEHGEMVDRHYLIPEDYSTFEWINNEKPEIIDSAFIDAIVGMSENYDPCINMLTEPTPDETVVIFNSWTNKITYTIIAISSILLILNLLNIKNHAKKPH